MYFLFFIVIPILIVLVLSLMILNQQFKNQAIENIKRSQEAIIANLESDEDVMSMRLSHMIYTNNSEILRYAAQSDTDDMRTRNNYKKKLSQTVNMILEPVKDIISVSFFMKDKREIYIINDIKKTQAEIKQTKWYQAALAHKNSVYIGFYSTKSTNDLYIGSKKDSLLLVFSLAPDVTTDRSQKIEMVMYYQSTGASERIKLNNLNYLAGKNKLGICQIIGTDGEIVYSTQRESKFQLKEYTCIKSPLKFNNTTWYVVNYIKTSELTEDYWVTAMWVLGAAILILLFAGYYSRYFLRSIIKPIEEISHGLRQVEEGNLEVHIAPKGQFELRNMIHQFNAMARRIRILVNEYEVKIRNVEKTPEDYFTALVKGEITPEDVNKKSKEFFMEHYALIGIHLEKENGKEIDTDCTSKLMLSFERNPRFASRCIIYKKREDEYLAFYRITEKEYSQKIVTMAENLQRTISQELGVHLFFCIGKNCFGYYAFEGEVKEIEEKMRLRYLKGGSAIINLEEESMRVDRIFQLAEEYERLAAALYIADEKNLIQEKDRMFELLNRQSLEEIKIQVYAAILAIGIRFSRDNHNFTDVFGHEYDYFQKIERIEDAKCMKLWLTNYFAWIMDYSASKLNVMETDMVVKAKRFIADHYEDAELSLNVVAEYVGLNEKYFTNRFSKETGETFSSYLTELRIQKARELLKSTNFKVYEIAEMVGYYNVEHFNRTFKKLNNISPAQYRKNT